MTEDTSGMTPEDEDRLGWVSLIAGIECWQAWWILVFRDLSVIGPEARDRFGRTMQFLSRR